MKDDQAKELVKIIKSVALETNMRINALTPMQRDSLEIHLSDNIDIALDDLQPNSLWWGTFLGLTFEKFKEYENES